MARPRTPAGRAKETSKRLAEEYPGSAKDLCELDFADPFQLLVATILSAQTTDVRVNMATPALFKKYPDATKLAKAKQGDVEEIIKSTGFFRNKAKSIIGMAQALEHDFDGHVPDNMEDLITLPGVGRKTANVVLSVAMDKPGIPVDTHVTRLSKRLGLTENTDPVKIEHDLMKQLPDHHWGAISLRLILHGRKVCVARKPKCDECILADFCPSSLVPVRSGG
jgi:endonuclease III